MKKSSSFRRRSVWLCSVSAALLLSASAGIAEDRIKRFHIPGQSLDAALVQFSEQSDVIIVAPQGLIEGKLAPEIRGDMPPEQALRKLLEGSGLNYSRNKDGAITIRLAAKSGAAQRQGATALAMLQEQTTDQGRNQAAGQDRERTPAQQEDELLEIEEIVITGSHIRGVGISVGSRVDVIDRLEIDRSGFATTQDLIRSLPQNFGGGANERVTNSANLTAGTGINLRGLGTDSTLLLINGRRVPVAGLNTDFFDVSNVPTTAIDRIEILSDGASAIYGTDAIAGVVNIIFRNDYEGAETRARFGTVTEGGQQEYQLAQTFGAKWETGNALISYEYYKRDRLENKDRDFAADSDLRPFGGDNFSTSFSNPGNIADPLTGFSTVAFAIPPGQDGTALTPGDLISGSTNFNNLNDGRLLFPEQERHGAFLSLSQKIGEDVKILAEGRYSTRDFENSFGGLGSRLFVFPSNPFFVDPFGGSPFIAVDYNFGPDLGPTTFNGNVENYSAVLEGQLELAGDWQVKAYGSYSQEEGENVTTNQVDFLALAAALADPDPATAFNPFGDGSNTNPATLEAIRKTEEQFTTSKVWSANILTDGTLFRLPGGDVKIAAGADYRKETFETEGTQSNVMFEREVFALFGEVFLPLFDEDNRRAGLEKLIVTGAVRYEDFSGIGREASTTNPKFGLLWSPVDGVNIRGTYGTSFKAPNLANLDETRNVIFVFPLDDPSSPLGSTFSIIQAGNNATLENETATTWTLGMDLTSDLLPGFDFSVTYFNIDFEDRIAAPPNDGFTALTEEDKFSSIVMREFTAADVDALCNDEKFLGDPALCPFLPIGAIVDARLNNTAETKVEGIDFNISYGFDTENSGRFDFRINGSYLLKFDEAFSASAPVTELRDTVNNPVDFRMRNSLTWSNRKGLAVTGYLNYTDSYTDTVSVPERDIDSWTTMDLTVSYNTTDRFASAGLNDVIFTVSILNLFNTDPPFVNNRTGVGFDPANATALGRFISFNITKKW